MIILDPNRKIKKIIIVGGIAIVLVLLLLFLPLVFRKKDNLVSGPPENINQARDKKIQKDFEKIQEIRKSQPDPIPSAEEIRKDMDKLIEERKASGIAKPAEEIKKDLDSLNGRFKQ